MKRTLLLSTIAFMAVVALNAQGTKIWNLGGDPTVAANGAPAFAVSAGIGNGDGSVGNPVWPVTINGLQLSGPVATPPAVPNVNMGQVEASPKTFTDANSVAFSFANRFKFNGGGYSGAAITDLTPTVNMPTQRYVSFAVTGNSTIRAIGITGSSNTTRRVFLTDGTNLIGTWKYYGTAVVDSTITYTGGNATLYIYCNQACNWYYLSATNVVSTSLKQALSDKGITFNGSEISNTKNVALEVYNVLGKKIADSTTSISTKKFLKGVYVVRIAGSNNAMKINI